MTQPDYFLIKLRADDSVDVKGRWTTQSEWIALQAQIRAALGSGGELPDNLPMLEAEFGDGLIKLVDLRGIDLSNLTIGKADLSYCCFDQANFFDTRFDGTYLQYSSMASARFDQSNWANVQASPISAPNAFFGNGCMSGSFLMRSDFTNADFAGYYIFYTALLGSMMVGAKLLRTKFRGVDITDVLFDRCAWAALQEDRGVLGLPLVINEAGDVQETTLAAA